jgi:large subunit ribosomal protein L23
MKILDIFKNKKNTEKTEKKEKATEVEKKPIVEEVKPKLSSLKPKVDQVATPKSAVVKEKRKKGEDSKDAYKILVKPLVTERATALAVLNKYCFMVANEANKITVKKAIKSLYGVEPIAVNMVKVRGKKVSYRRSFGKKKNWKKAIVTLKPEEKIEIYEGV